MARASRGFGWCTGLLGLALHWPAAAEPHTAIQSGLLFNTVCAQCHEAECAGRLSFSSGHTAAVAHMRRYVGAVSETTVQELFSLLRRMKERCAFPDMPIAVPADGLWSATDLAELREPSGRWYFIPLGTLEVGEYRLSLTADRPATLGIEVISADFERVLDEPRRLPEGQAGLTLTVSGAMPHYLRVAVPESALLTRVELAR